MSATWRPAVPALALTVVGFGSVYLRRLEHGFSNTDDYLYAIQTQTILGGATQGWSGLTDAWRATGSTSPLVPTLATPIASVSDHPDALVLIQSLFLVALLMACRWLLDQMGHRAPWAAATVVVCLPFVLGYSGMFHFAIAAAACSAAAVAAYLASDRFRVLRPSVAMGILMGLLSLTRVVSPVYMAAIAVPCLVDMARDHSELRLRVEQALLAVLISVAIGGPWWLMNGDAALDWIGVGYDSQSGFAEEANPLELIEGRLAATAYESGWLLAVPLAVGLVVVVVRRRDRTIVLAATIVCLGILLLSSSNNHGTAFALPLMVIAACAVISAVRFNTRMAVLVGMLLVAGVALPSASWVVGGRTLWVSGTPAEAQVSQACSCPIPDTEKLTRAVLDQVGERTVLVRADALVNLNGIRFVDPATTITSPGYGVVEIPTEVLAEAESVIAGRSEGAYHTRLDYDRADAQLVAAGFEVAWRREVSSTNYIEVWTRP